VRRTAAEADARGDSLAEPFVKLPNKVSVENDVDAVSCATMKRSNPIETAVKCFR
jgi:hypothetical protein